METYPGRRCRLRPRGQVTLPKAVLDYFGLQPGQELLLSVERTGIFLVPLHEEQTYADVPFNRPGRPSNAERLNRGGAGIAERRYRSRLLERPDPDPPYLP